MKKPSDLDFGKTGFALYLFRLRFRRLSLTQRGFAKHFSLTYSVVRNAEQGARPTAALRLIVAAIEADPDFMAAVAKRVQRLSEFSQVAYNDGGDRVLPPTTSPR